MLRRSVKKLSSGTKSDAKSSSKDDASSTLALDKDCINNIRVLSAEQPQQANSGHAGAPIGCAPMAYAIFMKCMKFAPHEPKWFARDRFVLSNGHACALLYSMLHLTGYDRPTMEDLKNFRQIDSVTAGHPENELLEGVEVSTGPLGQGISNAVGLACGEKHMAATFNKPGHKIIDNYTYVICGDGCLQEGVSSEACSLAGHLKLGKLIVLYDDNNITIDGDTSVSFTEDVGKRFESYGWQVLEVKDGNSTNVSNLVKAINKAKACTDKPSIIKVKTTIGYGATKQGTAAVHGAPIGWDDIEKLRKDFGLDPNVRFSVPEDVSKHMGTKRTQGEGLVQEWKENFQKYKSEFPKLAAELERRMKGELPENCFDNLPSFSPSDNALATRKSSAKVLNAMADAIPDIVGGSADLTSSNLTNLNNSHAFQADTPDGRYFHFGVREHGMTSILNGLAAYGGFIPFGATFLNFAGYALGGMRLSALSNFQVLYIMTHDSIGLGEDGPTHQPVGMLAVLRSMPNFYVFRPADANEVSGSYKAALEMRHSPSVLALSRQSLPNLEHSSIENVAKGAYIVHPADKTPQVTFVATGSEVSIAIEAAELLSSEGIVATVVSMPCVDLYHEQPEEYKKSLFLKGVPVISIEAAGPLGWSKISHVQLAMESFGKSGPGGELFKHFGFTKENAVDLAKRAISKLGGSCQWLVDSI